MLAQVSPNGRPQPQTSSNESLLIFFSCTLSQSLVTWLWLWENLATTESINLLREEKRWKKERKLAICASRLLRSISAAFSAQANHSTSMSVKRNGSNSAILTSGNRRSFRKSPAFDANTNPLAIANPKGYNGRSRKNAKADSLPSHIRWLLFFFNGQRSGHVKPTSATAAKW